MYKVIKIEDKEIPLKSTGRTARLYTQFFHRDFLADIFSMQKSGVNPENGDGLEEFKSDVIENIAWTLAKSANENIPNIDEWLEQFESPFALLQNFEKVISVIDNSFKTTVKAKKKQAVAMKK